MRWVIALSAATWILIGAVVVGLWGPKPSMPAPRVEASQAKGDAELGRCREMGEAAKDDPACRAAWASARAHFLGSGFEGGRP
jgi:conjugative transfer region protein TrbK